MPAWSLQHVAVWLEHATANPIAFAHSLEWACQLNLPLRVIAIAHPSVSAKINAWSEMAALRGVALETRLTAERTSGAVEQFLRSNGLCVFSDVAATHTERELLKLAAAIPNVCQLHCAAEFVPVSRVLVLCRESDMGPHYLESAACLCRAMEITPIVLILARSEREAEMKKEYAEGVFHSRRMRADVDFVIASKPEQAVSRVVSWRRCTHVIVPRSSEAPEGRPLGLTASVSVLVLPDTAGTLDMPGKIRNSRGILASLDREPIAAAESV